MILFFSKKSNHSDRRIKQKNSSPMTDNSRNNCYGGESREGNIKSKRMILIKVWGNGICLRIVG